MTKLEQTVSYVLCLLESYKILKKARKSGYTVFQLERNALTTTFEIYPEGKNFCFHINWCDEWDYELNLNNQGAHTHIAKELYRSLTTD